MTPHNLTHIDDPTNVELKNAISTLSATRQIYLTNVSRSKIANYLGRTTVKASVTQYEEGFLVTYITGGDTGAQAGVRQALNRIAPGGAVQLSTLGFTREAVERVWTTLPGKRFIFGAQDDGELLVMRID